MPMLVAIYFLLAFVKGKFTAPQSLQDYADIGGFALTHIDKGLCLRTPLFLVRPIGHILLCKAEVIGFVLDEINSDI